jgi:RpiB/LacA/LacB family sugar-phosphate isomerase
VRVGIAGDHAGFALKQQIAEQLWLADDEVVDFGADRLVEGDDFPDYVIPLARAVAQREVERGIAVCGSGIGAAITASKLPGVRACVCHDHYSAHQGVEHDDMNVLCLGARVIGPELALELVSAFLWARFSSSESHVRRLEKLRRLEAMCARGAPEDPGRL